MQTVILTDHEAKSFLAWRKNQESCDIMIRSGFFNLANGSAEVHFSNGNITKIDTHAVSFRRVSVVIPIPKLEKLDTPKSAIIM